LVAKACGVKCEKFYVGFDFLEFKIPILNWSIPRSLLKFQWGETEYGIGSLPLGGYVKMLGQDDDPRNAEHEAARIRAAAPHADSARVEAIATGHAAEGFVDGQSVEKLTNEALAHPHPGSTTPEEAPVAAQTTEGKTILLDPRSYPAKPVPARMAIISAGVIMNLIFAVILAAVAYGLGVEEMPAIVGSTSAGGAAWTQGIEPGSRVIQIGRNGEPYESLRWTEIRTSAVLNNGQDVALKVRQPNGEDKWYDVRPVKSSPEAKFPQMGIGMPYKPEVETFPEIAAYLNPKSNVPLKDFDRIIEAGGQKITSGADLMTVFAQKPLGELAVKVERRERDKFGKLVKESTKAPEVFDAVVQPKPMREFGLNMKMGPISAVQKNSPAEKADLQVGDVIVEVNGQPIGDPLSLSQRVTPTSSEAEPVTLVVERKDRQGQMVKHTVSVRPQQPSQSPTQMPTQATSIEPLGVAFDVLAEVAEVVPSGPAAEAGMLPGDVVTMVQFLFKDDAAGRKLMKTARVPPKIEIGPKKSSWPLAFYVLQRVPPDVKTKLTWTRAGKTMSGEMLAKDATNFFADARGMELYLDLDTHIAKNLQDAAALGFREAKEQLTQVLTILHRLVTLRLSATNLSGPFGIIGFAGQVASQGISPLLLFLTMLSANLAVLNFLPIPALDGGHMLFLSAEAVRGKPVDERLQMRLTVAGVICLLSLMVFATMMDLNRWVGN
jgi:regulator of sigma E protease